MQHHRWGRAAGLAGLAFAVLTTTAGPAGASPAPTASPVAAGIMPTGTTEAGEVTITPGYLPDGFVFAGRQDITVPDTLGQMTVHVARYARQATDAPRPDAVVYLKVGNGLVDGLTAASGGTTTVTPTTVSGLPGLYVETDALREYRWVLDPGQPDVLGTVGALGLVTPEELLAIAESVVYDGVASLEQSISDGPAPDECNCPMATNMKGSGVPTNDWSGDGPNRTIRYGSTGNDVGVWQAILWADGAHYLANGDYHPFRPCHVDGIFGYRTEDSTKYWQMHLANPADPYQIASDGIVGQVSWGWADNHLTQYGGTVYYEGWDATLTFRRQTASPYYYTWSWWGQSYRYTGYSGITFSKIAC